MAVRRPVPVIVGVLALVAVVVVGLAAARLLDRPADGAGPETAPSAPTTSPSRTPSPSTDSTAAPRDRTGCDAGARSSFTPSRVDVAGVLRADVVPMPRDDQGVPGVLPIDQKHAFAIDGPGGVRPGDRRGHVLLNTHTWPDGSASGNALLRELTVGDRIVLRGEGRRLCYDVTAREEVRVEDGYPGYGATDGPPELVIVVCSGERRGPGDWSHRTLWFAEPVR